MEYICTTCEFLRVHGLRLAPVLHIISLEGQSSYKYRWENFMNIKLSYVRIIIYLHNL